MEELEESSGSDSSEELPDVKVQYFPDMIEFNVLNS